ncbi:MAG: hypothetical protein KatS3mg090_0502 [Patescibacteria group bacterium]|nr:MAG: hypothetical protein KatS3mg090_0502 [Patescibacteria group bacterium]
MILKLFKNKWVVFSIFSFIFLALFGYFFFLNTGLQFFGFSPAYQKDNKNQFVIDPYYEDQSNGIRDYLNSSLHKEGVENLERREADYGFSNTSISDSSISNDTMYQRNFYVSLTVSDVKVFSERLSAFVESVGGVIIDKSVSFPEENYYGYASFRVPANKLDEVRSFFRDNSLKIVSEVESASDITDNYIDISQRLSRLNDTKERLSKLYDSAKDVADIIEIHKQIQQIETQIESLIGRQRYLQESVDTILVTVYFSSDESRLPFLPDDKFDPVLTFKKAVRQLLVVVYRLIDFAIYSIVFSVIVIPVIVLVYILKFVRSRFFLKDRSQT